MLQSDGPHPVYGWAFFGINKKRSLARSVKNLGPQRILPILNWAVCAGDFVMPASKVQLMYAPEISGGTARGQLRIEDR